MPLPQVSVERSTFNANGGVDRAQVIYAGFNGEVSMSLKNNVFANSTGSPSVNATVCLTNGGTATRTPRVDVSRNTGLDPARRSSNKTAPWWVPFCRPVRLCLQVVPGGEGAARLGCTIARH